MKEKKFIAMSQPTFLPWSGYFDLIDSVENFVFLNDAQFSKLSWHSRNKIIINNKTSWVSLPVFHKSNDQLINDTLIISNKKNLNKILKTIKQNYSKTKFYNIYSDEFENKLLKCFSFKFLDEFNIEIIKWIIDKIGIKTKVFKSSDLKINEARSNRIIKICEKFKTKNYLSAYGALDYLKKDLKLFAKRKISISLQNYHTVNYKQLQRNFDGYVSILDMLFNEGPNTLNLIRKSRKDKYIIL